MTVPNAEDDDAAEDSAGPEEVGEDVDTAEDWLAEGAPTVHVGAPGKPALVLVATPIGNMGDLSRRAAEELAGADLIACEDTRRTGRLLQLSGIGPRPLLRIDEHTEIERTPRIIDRLADGARVVLVSDAGTPALSDPGERLVRAVLAAGHPVEVIPGPCAAITALVGSGLPAGRFCFEGFLPRRGGPRRAQLAQLATEARTMVFYESPHRLAATLTDLIGAFGPDRPLTVARELTKLHEQWWRGSLRDALAWAQQGPVRGEVVLVVAGAPPASTDTARSDLETALVDALAGGASVRDAASEVAGALGVNRRQAYQMALRIAGRSAGDPAPERP
ncbi:MAG: 16S rRNA (cytidine(1402)-2'-O)-methyltransferase [Acidimicrobiales bacterium]